MVYVGSTQTPNLNTPLRERRKARRAKGSQRRRVSSRSRGAAARGNCAVRGGGSGVVTSPEDVVRLLRPAECAAIYVVSVVPSGGAEVTSVDEVLKFRGHFSSFVE